MNLTFLFNRCVCVCECECVRHNYVLCILTNTHTHSHTMRTAHCNQFNCMPWANAATTSQLANGFSRTRTLTACAWRNVHGCVNAYIKTH